MNMYLMKGALALTGFAGLLFGMTHAAAQDGGGSESPFFHKAGATEIYSGANARTEFLLTAEESRGAIQHRRRDLFPRNEQRAGTYPPLSQRSFLRNFRQHGVDGGR